MSTRREQIINAVTGIDSTREIEMLNIRPYVKKEDYCFRVFDCNLGSVMKRLQDASIIKGKCLVVTSPRALESAKKRLPKDFHYVYINDTKVNKLDNFVDNCNTDAYVDNAKDLKDELAELYRYINVQEEDPGTIGPSESAWKMARDLEKRIAEKKLPSYVLNAPFNANDIDVVIALGGGVAMDAGQYIATKLKEIGNKDLIFLCVPTALSVNAAFCYKAALRKLCDESESQGEEKYVVEYFNNLIQPDALLMDYDIILTAGNRNVIGAGDLLSCLTATFDWKLNSLVARNYTPVKGDISKPFNQEICDGAMELVGLLAENIDNLNAMRTYGDIFNEEIEKGTSQEEAKQKIDERIVKDAREGLTFLCKAYHWVAEQSWIMQHTMWESASEHGMFDYMEHLCGVEFSHGQIIGLCVYFMSRLQENEHERAVSMIKRLKLDITLNNLAIKGEDREKVTLGKLRECLTNLKAFLTRMDYRYTIINAKDITDTWIKEALQAYCKDFPYTPDEAHVQNWAVAQYEAEYKP